MPTWFPSAIIRQNDAEDFGRQASGLVDELGARIGDANQQISGHVKSFLPSLESLTPWAQQGGEANGLSALDSGSPAVSGAGAAVPDAGPAPAAPQAVPTRDDYARPSSALPSLETLTPWAQQTPSAMPSDGAAGLKEGPPQDTTRPDEYNAAPAEPVQRGGDLRAYARQAAERNGVDPNIFERQITQESGFNPTAGSPAGAQGIAQIMPQYHPGVDTSDPYASLDYAAQLMGSHLKTYGGDYRKALQAYNAGPGAVASGAADTYGETNRYTANILGGGDAGASSAVAGDNSRLPRGGQSTSGPDRVGDLQVDQAALDDPDKWALCGPVAAVLAATKRGGDWSVAQAKQLATSLGLWDPSQGMHGLGSEVQLLNKLGISASTGAADQQRLAEDAQNGNTPVVSTDGHYFVLQGYDPSTGKFDTGTTGTVYKGGSRWLSLDDMQRLAGNIQGAAYIDNPASPSPSTTAGPSRAQAAQADLLQGRGGTQALERSGADTSDQVDTGNPDQPSGLSRAPAASATPTFPAPPTPLYQDQPESDVYTPRAIDQPAEVSRPALSDFEQAPTPPPPLYADQPESDVYTPRASDNPAPTGQPGIVETFAPGGILSQGIRKYSGMEQAEQEQHRWIEIGKFASDNGYFGAIDPKFRRDYPELADEADALTLNLVMGVAGGGDLEAIGGMFGGPARQAARSVPTWASSVDNPAARYDMHYEIRPLYELQASHTDAFTPNPDFPAEIQPRIRDRLASREQVGRIAQNLTPDALLAETHRLDSGAPIIGPDGAVESGNGRMLALRQAQQQHPERWTDYQQQLRARADELGLDPQQIERTPNPVLVRVRTSEVDRPAFAAEANRSAVLEMSPYERAQQDATRINPDLMAGIQVSETQGIDQALMAPGNRDALRAIMATIPQNERAALVTGTGELNAQGLQRIKQALFSATYPGEAGRRLSETFSESLDSGVRNIESGLFQSLPAMARAEGLIRVGERPAELSLSSDLAAAVDVLARLKQERMGVPDYLGQSSMFERELTPLQEQLLGHLDSLSRAPRRIRDFIQEYANGVESEPHTAQTGMFGEVARRSKGELVDRAAGGATNAEGLEGQAAQTGIISRADPGLEQGVSAPTPAAAPEGNRLAGPAAREAATPPGGPQGLSTNPADYLYTTVRDFQGESLRGSEASPVWFSDTRGPIGRPNEEVFAVRKDMLDPTLLRTAANGYPTYHGEVPPGAVLRLGKTGLTDRGTVRFDTQASLERAVAGGPPPPTGQTPPSNRGRLPQLQRPINWRAPTPPQPPRGARPIELTAEQEAKRLNLSKFPAEIHDDLLRSAQGVDWARAQRRGVLPDAVVNDLADEMGRSVESWIRQKAGRAYSPEETVALRNAVTAQGFKVADLSSQVNAAKSAGLTTDLLLAQFDAEAQKLRGLVQVAEGARAEAGRTLRAYSFQTRNVEANPSDAAARLVKKFGGDRQKALDAIGEFNQLVESGAGPVEQAKFWARAEGGPVGFEDWFRALRYNSMLSGPRTFEINAVGNLAEIPWRLARDAGASTLRGRPQEMAPELTGLWVGMQKGAGAFMETLQHGITTEQALAGDLPRGLASRIENPIGRSAATVLEAPGRVMQASDALAHQMAYGLALGREAAVKARGAAGWAGEVERLMDNPTEQMMSNALGVADRMTYKGEMGALGTALGGFQKVPYLGNIILPFLRTVYHITARGIDRSPLGLVGTGIDVARGAYRAGAVPRGAAPLGERLGDNLMGTVAGAFLVGQAFQGNISASGPEDPRQKDLLRGQGWQPYSVKVGDNWVSYSNWGPAAVPFSMAAALAEANLYKKPTDNSLAQGLDTFRRFGELATEQTYLQGVGAFYKAAKDPQAYGTQWLTGFVTSLVPFGSAVNTVGQAQDPLQRRPERYDVGGAIAARLPGLRESQPPAQDVLGRPIANEMAKTGFTLPLGTPGESPVVQVPVPGAFSPIRTSPIKDEPVLKAFADAGVEIGRPSDAMTVDGVKISLTPAEQRRYLELRGQLIQRFAPRVINSAGYQRGGPQAKEAALNGLLDDVLAAARDQMIGSIGGAEVTRRVREGAKRAS